MSQGGDPEGPGLSVGGESAPVISSGVIQGKSHNLSDPSFPHPSTWIIRGAPQGTMVKVRRGYASRGLSRAPGIQKELKKRGLAFLQNLQNSLKNQMVTLTL